jgi:hypothetical protein
MSIVTIIVVPVGRYGNFDAFFASTGQRICRSSAPLLTSARILLARGANPADIIAMVYAAKPDVVAMTAPIGIAARYDVSNDHFVRHHRKGACGVRFAPPVRFDGAPVPNPHPTLETLPCEEGALP